MYYISKYYKTKVDVMKTFYNHLKTLIKITIIKPLAAKKYLM